MNQLLNLVLFVLCLVAVSHSEDFQEHEEYVPFIGTRRDNFDFNLLKEVVRDDPNNNFVISPFSTKIVLMMLAEMSGLNSDTRKEIVSALKDINDVEDGRRIFTKAIKSLLEVNPGNTVICGSNVFVTDKLLTSNKLEAIYQRNYKAFVTPTDFTNVEAATNNINKWVSDITKGNLKHFVQKESVVDAVVLLINAVFFEGSWRTPFKSNRTVQQDFYVSSNAPVKTDFMKAKGEYYFAKSTKLSASLLRLPYVGGKFAMFLILPDANVNVNTLTEKLDSRDLHREMWYLDEEEVIIELPKFSIKYPLDLKPRLMNLGVHSIFTQNASLPLLARGAQTSTYQLLVSNILQESGITVNEEGTTVFSATQAQLINKIGGKPNEFIANRPFIFYIEDETTGNIMFAGRVTNPSLQN